MPCQCTAEALAGEKLLIKHGKLVKLDSQFSDDLLGQTKRDCQEICNYTNTRSHTNGSNREKSRRYPVLLTVFLSLSTLFCGMLPQHIDVTPIRSRTVVRCAQHLTAKSGKAAKNECGARFRRQFDKSQVCERRQAIGRHCKSHYKRQNSMRRRERRRRQKRREGESKHERNTANESAKGRSHVSCHQN